MNFQAMLKFLLLVDYSGSLLLLKLSRSSKQRSIDSSSLCLLFSNLIRAWYPFIPDPKRLSKISKMLSTVSHSSTFLATKHFSAAPSSVLSIAVHACLSSFRFVCSKCCLISAYQVSMQPSASSLNSFGFLKGFSRFTSFSINRLCVPCDECFKCPVHYFPSMCPSYGIKCYI